MAVTTGRSPLSPAPSGGARSPRTPPSIRSASGRVSPRVASERQASGRQAFVEFDVSHESAALAVVKKDRDVVSI